MRVKDGSAMNLKSICEGTERSKHMFVKRDGTSVVIRIDSKLGTCKPIFPLSFSCGTDQEYAELAARQLDSVIKKAFEKVAREHYDRGFADGKSKQKRDNWADIPFSFE